MKPNRAMLSRLFEPVSPALIDAAIYHLGRAGDRTTAGSIYNSSMFSDGLVEVTPEPLYVKMPKPDSYFNVMVWDCGKEDALKGHGTYMNVRIPMSMLIENPGNYFVYNLSFQGDTDGEIDNSSPLQYGYFGITKRNPFLRFREHQRDARNRTGHILHKTWNGLVNVKAKRTVTFGITDHYKTLNDAYAAEEALVDEFTLAPKGLNAIPGGMKGIRMMHQLRLLNGTSQISVEDRDNALIRLEGKHDRNSPCAHYRTGHFRNLPSGKMTWVSPCWVNPTTLSTAA